MTVAEYNESVENYADDLYRFVLSNLKNEAEAQDIVQDTFEKVWRKRAEVSYSKIKSYLFSTAYHTMIDKIRKRKKETDLGDVEYNKYYHERQYNGLQEVLHKALDQLPAKQRSVVLLRDYEGYSYKEIETITGLNASQVKVYIYRARKKLRRFIGRLDNVI